jgi:hypothetical protein
VIRAQSVTGGLDRPATAKQLLTGGAPLHFGLFGHLWCVINLYSEVPDGTLQLAVSKQQLHRSQVLRTAVDQRRFRAPQCVRAAGSRIETDPSPIRGQTRTYWRVDR